MTVSARSGARRRLPGGGDFEDFFAGQGFGRDMGPEFGDGVFSEFFERLFGDGAMPRPSGPLRGRDIEAVLELSLEDALAGATRRLSLGDGHSVTVNIPAGVREGQRIRVAGRGPRGAMVDRPVICICSCVWHPTHDFAARATTFRSM